MMTLPTIGDQIENGGPISSQRRSLSQQRGQPPFPSPEDILACHSINSLLESGSTGAGSLLGPGSGSEGSTASEFSRSLGSSGSLGTSDFNGSPGPSGIGAGGLSLGANGNSISRSLSGQQNELSVVVSPGYEDGYLTGLERSRTPLSLPLSQDPRNRFGNYSRNGGLNDSPMRTLVENEDMGLAELQSKLNYLALTSCTLSRQDQNIHNGRQHDQHRRNEFSANGNICCWTGKLPPRCSDPEAGFSCKLFLGGLPWDVTEIIIARTFQQFELINLEWPGKETASTPRGFVYATFKSEERVRDLLMSSRYDQQTGNWYYRISSKKMNNKETPQGGDPQRWISQQNSPDAKVQIIPWSLGDTTCIIGDDPDSPKMLDSKRTVFVGALHGMMSARGLALVMDDLFGGVIYAGIDTDKQRYPIGSGRVFFNNSGSYHRAVAAGYIEIRTSKFSKKIQVDPYLEDSPCSVCNVQQGPYFCKEPTCFMYFCRTCWECQHVRYNHKPNMRRSKKNTASLTAPSSYSSLLAWSVNGSNGSMTALNGSLNGLNAYGNVGNCAGTAYGSPPRNSGSTSSGSPSNRGYKRHSYCGTTDLMEATSFQGWLNSAAGGSSSENTDGSPPLNGMLDNGPMDNPSMLYQWSSVLDRMNEGGSPFLYQQQRSSTPTGSLEPLNQRMKQIL